MGEPTTRVLIVGGGFAGVYAALEFERRQARDSRLAVTLVNRDNFFLFTPMLHEVAASDLDITHIVNPLRKLLRRIGFFNGDVSGIDLERRIVTVAHGSDGHTHDLRYDHLVLAPGATTNFFDIPGVAEQALTMKSLADAIALRNRLIACLEEADTECAAALRDRLLTFVVAGGGFSGVETIAGMNDFVHEALAYYPHLAPEMIHMVLVHPGAVILPELSPSLGRYAGRKLEARGVEIRFGTKVAAATDATVTLSDGSVLPAATLVWTAGTMPSPLLGTLPLRKEEGRVVVNRYLAVPDWPGVWAIGDCALVPDLRNGGYHPPTAQHAMRQGRCLAHNVTAAAHGGALRTFSYRTLGQLASLGRRTGVAEILGMRFSGFLAWWLWRTIYLAKLPRMEKKVRVALDWSLDLVFSKDIVELVGSSSVESSSVTPLRSAKRSRLNSSSLPSSRKRGVLVQPKAS